MIDTSTLPGDGASLIPPRRRRLTVPSFASREILFDDGQRLLYLRVMFMPRRRWDRSRWAKEPGWWLLPFGAFMILAVKLEG